MTAGGARARKRPEESPAKRLDRANPCGGGRLCEIGFPTFSILCTNRLECSAVVHLLAFRVDAGLAERLKL